jgi:hypothetical protein
MSRPITDKEIILVDSMWEEIDEIAQAIEEAGASEIAQKNPAYLSLLLGRKEMLDMMGDWLKKNSFILRDLLEKHGYDID